MATDPNDLLARFIRNEKKAKTWTLLSVGIFLLLAFGILYLMTELKKAKDETEKAREDTARALARADSINNALEMFKTSQENVVKSVAAPEKIPTIRPTLVPSTGPVETRPNQTPRSQVTVYVQYKNEYYDQCNQLVNALKQEKFNVPGKELIAKINFKSSIKYFNDEDKMWADSVALIFNNTLRRSGKARVPVVRNNIKAPRGQLEVWMGDYRTEGTTALIQKYSPKASKLKKAN
jgi:hypothetical protein